MEGRYLFKAKRIDNGEWVQGNLMRSDDAEDDYEAIIIPTNDSNMFTKGGSRGDLGFEIWHKVDKDTLCQCTGLRDKNGRLIFENDIVALCNEDKAERYATGSVEYGDFNCSCCYGVYGWSFSDNADIREVERYEVVGNIFDNKESLEGEEE